MLTTHCSTLTAHCSMPTAPVSCSNPHCSMLSIPHSKLKGTCCDDPAGNQAHPYLAQSLDDHVCPCPCPQVLHVVLLALRDLAFSLSSSGSFMLIGGPGSLIGILHTPMGSKIAVVGTSSALTGRARAPAQILCQPTPRSDSRDDARCVANHFGCSVAAHA